MVRPRLGQNTWGKQKELAIEVLLLALAKLQTESNLPQDEKLLSRKLYIYYQQANHEIWVSSKGKKGFEYLPVQESNNPPSIDDEERAKREDKIPDLFLCTFQDHVEIIRTGKILSGQKYLVAECKCLGKTRKSGWNLNRNYIENGVLRFILEEYGYAQDQDLGIMVGYVQNMDFSDILQEVNTYSNSNTKNLPITPLLLSVQGWQQAGISFLAHKINRKFPISPFPLQHYWVDLRSNYPTVTTQKNNNHQQINQIDPKMPLEQLSFPLEDLGS
jgi:hypothetical protein